MTRKESRLFTDYLLRDRCERFGLVDNGDSLSASPNAKARNPDVLAEKPANVKKGTAQGSKPGRIFVARIPSRVSEEDLREHFEMFGEVEDAYRPRDFAKNTYRGIGFVTFVDPAAVDRVIATKHTLGGAEVVVDRATPKELSSSMERQAGAEETLRRYPSVEAMANNYPAMDLRGFFNEQFDANSLNSFPQMATYPNSIGNNRGPPSNFSDDFLGDVGLAGFASELYDSNTSMIAAAAVMKQPSTPGAPDGKAVKGGSPRLSPTKNEKNHKTMTDNFAHVRKVRSGPRIFVGKISKDTVEQDLADYFTQFGFVMDVYIPRSRENKKEHRGFGFVTFETEASIKRAISQGTHNLKGAVLAIDVAVPESSPSN